MKKSLIPTIIVLIIFMCLLPVNSSEKSISKPHPLLSQVEGEWLNEQYVNRLRSTKSPIKSMQGIYEVYYDINKKGKDYEWFTVYNFHEGSPIKLIVNIKALPEENTYKLMLKKGDPQNYYPDNKTNYEFVIDKKSKSCKIFSSNGKQKMSFVKINSRLANFVNSIVLAGKYQDSNGLRYEFNSDGTGKWADKSFKYEINLDPIFNKYDYFCLIDSKGNRTEVLYCFERKDDKLLIYKAKILDESEFIERENKPFLILNTVELNL